MFKTPGNFDCTIIDAFIAEPKFGPKDGETMNVPDLGEPPADWEVLPF